MSNKYRTATTTRRGARTGFPEHDDFEGLPVRQWRQEWVNVASAPPAESSTQNDIWDRELFYGMPKDAHLLPPHSQELLRLARSGRLYKRPAPADDDDMENDGLETKGDKKDSDAGVEGFMVKTWKQMPGNADGPTVSHLAKRHKNTVTLPSKAMLAQITGPTATRHKVRRIDAAGNPYEQTVTVADGQKVDGEIISTTIVPLHPTNPEVAGQPQTTPARRKPPPPKRKAKGPGRGRKKGRLPLAAGAAPAPVQQPLPTGGVPAVKTETSAGSDAVKIEENEDSANQDSEMADNSAMPSEDEDGEDGDEGDEERGPDEGDETPEVENVGDQDQEMEDVDVIRPSSIEEPVEERPRSTSEEEITVPKARFQPPPGLGNLGPRLSSPRVEGSPLKNVIIQSPIDQSPMVSPQAGAGSFTAGSSYMAVHTSMTSVVGTGVVESNPTPAATTSQSQGSEAVPSLSTTAGIDEIATASALPSEPLTNPTETLAPTIESPTKEQAAAAPQQTDAPATIPSEETRKEGSNTPPIPAVTSAATTTIDIHNKPTIIEPVAVEPAQEQQQQQQTEPAIPSESRPKTPDSPTLHPTATGADEDEGLNLLGSLERELDRQEDSLSRSGSAGASNSNGGGDKAQDVASAPSNDAGKGLSESAAGGEPATATATTTSAAAAAGGDEDGAAAAANNKDETKQEQGQEDQVMGGQ